MVTGIKTKLAALTALALASASSLQAQVALPTPLGDGVLLSDYISVAITGLGGIMVTVIGGFFAFKLITLGMKKVNKIGG
tara:strand:+ start:209 stop:448 length:240 start_codon:yes stop_codon:yes gene_type:complete